MSRPRRQALKEQRHDQVREEILEATMSVLLRKGPGGFTLNAVARELQLTKAALYYYFDSKETLLFELIYRGLDRQTQTVGDAVEATDTGADALKAMIRATAGYYGARMDELRLTYMMPQADSAGSMSMTDERFERLRPFNDRIFGAVAERIEADQEAGRIPGHVPARRLAFVAHTSVLGMLLMEGLVESVDDPLLHARPAMVDELVRAFHARLRPGG